jgi:hypothetical protein
MANCVGRMIEQVQADPGCQAMLQSVMIERGVFSRRDAGLAEFQRWPETLEKPRFFAVEGCENSVFGWHMSVVPDRGRNSQLNYDWANWAIVYFARTSILPTPNPARGWPLTRNPILPDLPGHRTRHRRHIPAYPQK